LRAADSRAAPLVGGVPINITIRGIAFSVCRHTNGKGVQILLPKECFDYIITEYDAINRAQIKGGGEPIEFATFLYNAVKNYTEQMFGKK